MGQLDYALIGNCQSSALVDKQARIVWACLPRFDSEAVFSSLLDAEKAGVWSILPETADAHTPYGATEALPVSSITAREVLQDTAALTRIGKGTCVGRTLPDITMRIIRITDDAIPAWDDQLVLPHGEIGEIVVKGPVVTREYFHRDEATALAKIQDGTNWWHRMGDVGYLDEQQRTWFCGRKADRVRTASGTLFTVPCEAVFNQHPGVGRSALVGLGLPGQQQPVIVIEPHRDAFPSNAGATRRFTDELLKLGTANPLTAGITSILFHRAFPVFLSRAAVEPLLAPSSMRSLSSSTVGAAANPHSGARPPRSE